MASRLDTRLRRLEAQSQGTDTALAPGLSGLLAYARAHHIAAAPIADLYDAELDAKITALAGARGLALLLREALQWERTRRQGAPGKEPPACAEHSPTRWPDENNRPTPAMPPGLSR